MFGFYSFFFLVYLYVVFKIYDFIFILFCNFYVKRVMKSLKLVYLRKKLEVGLFKIK